MKVAQIYRSKDRKEYSIEALFESLKKYFMQSYDIEDVFLPAGRYNHLKDLIKNIIFSRKINADIYHITGEVYFIAPVLPKDKTILTVHDFVDLEKFKGLKKIIRYIFWYYIPFHHCKYIGCISHKVLNELIERFPFTKNKAFYAPNPIDDSYIASKKAFSQKPTILLIGTRENKNIERVFEAVKDLECKLFIIGVLNDEQKYCLSKNKIEYENVFHISDEEVRQAYINCDILCFPSTYEGFGRPIIEANAVGRPVVTSNIEPMLEVGNDAAFFVNPYDIESIKDGLTKIINDFDLREKLINAGYQNAKKYHAERIANIYINIYKKVENK